MKIEKISDTQVKFILTQDDLTDKNIKLEDLAVSNDKTKELFQDILSKALDAVSYTHLDVYKRQVHPVLVAPK